MIVWISSRAVTHCLHTTGHAMEATELPRAQTLTGALDHLGIPARTL